MADSITTSQSQIDLTSAAPLFDQGLFSAINIDGNAWSTYRPYQLCIVEVKPDGNGVRYAVTPWKFTLPISPQELTIDTPVASEVRATLTGITEQHSGAPFQMISFSATTGMVPATLIPGLPDRNTAPLQSGTPIFAGTVTAASNLVATAKGFGAQPPNLNKFTLATTPGDPDSIFVKSTGFYQFQLLKQFLQAYIAMKKSPAPVKNLDKDKTAAPYSKIDPRNVRLAFCTWKDSSVYLCTLGNFRESRQASAPLEYNYSMSLKAWARVQLDQGFASDLKDGGRLAGLNPSSVQKALATVQQAIAVVNATIALIQAVVQDVVSVVNGIADVMRTVASALKSIAGLVQTVADLPATLQNECLDPIRNQWRNIRTQWAGLQSAAGQVIDAAMTASQNAGLGNPAAAVSVTDQIDFQAPATAAALQDMLASFSPNQLQLPQALAAAIRAQGQRVQALTATDFAVMRDQVLAFIDDYTELIGAGDPEYARLYGRPIRKPVKVADANDFQMLFALQDAAQVLDGLSASAPLTNTSLPTSIDYIAGLAEQSGVVFKRPVSKFAIPFPHGGTLEQLAQQYLGDSDRWMEIAALNGLQQPYVDEEGLEQPLLVNADAATVVVADSEQLFLGQTVYLAAAGVIRQTRHILSIKNVASGYVVLTLDGLASLNAFTVAAGSQLQYFTPNTVNSQKVLYIPSDQVGLTPFDSRDIPGVDQFDPLINLVGIAVAVDSKNDLIFSPSGRSQSAVGLQNIIQKIRIMLATPLGSILHYPALGFKLQVGANLSEVNANQVLDQARKMFTSDPVFSGLNSGLVELRGNAMILSLNVGIASLNTFVSVSTEITTS